MEHRFELRIVGGESFGTLVLARCLPRLRYPPRLWGLVHKGCQSAAFCSWGCIGSFLGEMTARWVGFVDEFFGSDAIAKQELLTLLAVRIEEVRLSGFSLRTNIELRWLRLWQWCFSEQAKLLTWLYLFIGNALGCLDDFLDSALRYGLGHWLFWLGLLCFRLAGGSAMAEHP